MSGIGGTNGTGRTNPTSGTSRISRTSATSGTGRSPATGPATGPALLRGLLRAFEEAAPGEGLAQIADRLGIGRAEAADLAAYWVRKGRLRREEIGGRDCGGCPAVSRSCTGCPSGGPGPAAGPAAGSATRPVLVALSPVRPVRPVRPVHTADPARSEGPVRRTD
ncbi:hypothetical protein SAVIM338S_01056 [Streptomyces avidinii]